MRLEIILKKGKKITLKGIQQLTYEAVEKFAPGYSKTIHDKGYEFISGSVYKSYKPFVYSYPYTKKDGHCAFKISAVGGNTAYTLVNGIRQMDIVKDIRVLMGSYNRTGGLFRLLSPVAVKNREGQYLMPGDKEYRDYIHANAARKYITFFSPEEDFNDVMSDKPLWITWERCEVITKKYKDSDINAAWGVVKLVGDSDLINTVYRLGLGCKNALGFGMIETCRR